MNLEETVSRYIGSAEQVIEKIEITKEPQRVDLENIKNVVEWARTYLEDAKYYRDKKRFEVSLTSVAYCEGLLDALKLLGAVSFEWTPDATQTRKAK